jgi:hypothetical protein
MRPLGDTDRVMKARNANTEVKFNDAQLLDVRARDRNNAQVWQWSAGQVLAQSLTTRTLAAGEPVTCLAHRKPSAPGEYHAMAYLTSSAHAAVAFTTVSAPCRADRWQHRAGRSAS